MRVVLVIACGLCVPSLCSAQAYPSKVVRVVTPWPTGGLTDVVGRLIFQKISETSGQQFVIDNRPGAAGTIGADFVAKSKPDGYTLMVHSTTHVGNPHIYKQLPYDTLKDFVGIGLLSAQTGLLVVHPSLPVKNVKELIAFAKARPNEILYATSGSGSFSHLAIALLTSMTKTQMTHVPYKGGGPATTSIVAGETQFLVGSPAAVVTQLDAKRLRLLAVSADTRLTQFPQYADGGRGRCPRLRIQRMGRRVRARRHAQGHHRLGQCRDQERADEPRHEEPAGAVRTVVHDARARPPRASAPTTTSTATSSS